MNSTGKGLSCADLVRNFVLMDFPITEQQKVHHSYWRQLEVVLARVKQYGTVRDDVFADFTHCYLTEVEARQGFAAIDACQALKAHAWQTGYKGQGRMRFFCLDLRDHANTYASALPGEHHDAATHSVKRVSPATGTGQPGDARSLGQGRGRLDALAPRRQRARSWTPCARSCCSGDATPPPTGARPP